MVRQVIVPFGKFGLMLWTIDARQMKNEVGLRDFCEKIRQRIATDKTLYVNIGTFLQPDDEVLANESIGSSYENLH
jgi:hypothetical protein